MGDLSFVLGDFIDVLESQVQTIKIPYFRGTSSGSLLTLSPTNQYLKCKKNPQNEFVITDLPLIDVLHDFVAYSVKKMDVSSEAIFDLTPEMIANWKKKPSNVFRTIK